MNQITEKIIKNLIDRLAEENRIHIHLKKQIKHALTFYSEQNTKTSNKKIQKEITKLLQEANKKLNNLSEDDIELKRIPIAGATITKFIKYFRRLEEVIEKSEPEKLSKIMTKVITRAQYLERLLVLNDEHRIVISQQVLKLFLRVPFTKASERESNSAQCDLDKSDTATAKTSDDLPHNMDDLAIGIDLGTTNSCISVYINGEVKILENESGERITPSFVYFSQDGGVIIGEHAKKMAVHNPENGVYEIKRLVGRKYDDAQLQKTLDYFPFQVTPDEENLPGVCIKQKGEVARKSPQELYTVLLKALKRYAEVKLNETIKKAVITVPAYFNVKQREVTLEAAKNAGFTVLKLLNEPTAAALAYYFDSDIEDTHLSLVYDLGGGTFDVAILQQRQKNIEVLSVSGDTQLGGHDFDNLILDHISQVLQNKYDYDPKYDADDKRRLRKKCEEAKKELSTMDEAVININGMIPQHPKIKIVLTRKQFETMAEKLFRKTIHILHLCLRNTKIPKNAIQAVILCGGSTRIPKIQHMISDYFDGIQLNKVVNPDECVAEGAALQAAMLSESTRQNIEMLKMVDVVPISLGFNDLVNEMIFLIRRNTKIPIAASRNYTTTYNNQSGLDLGIYEGERLDARKNRYLGNLSMDGLTQAAPGQVEVIATLTIDHNGILTAKAQEKYADKVKELKVNYTSGDRSDSEISNTLLDAENNKESDGKFQQFAKLKSYLINYCVGVVYNLENMDLVDTYQEIYDFCIRTEELLDEVEMDKMVEVKAVLDECKRRCDSLVLRYKFELLPQLE